MPQRPHITPGLGRRWVTTLAGMALVATGALAGPASAAPSNGVATATAPANAGDSWTPRPEQYPNTVKRTDLAIEMSDGVVLRGDLVLPADAEGNAIDQPVPVVVTITAYNKTVLANEAAGTLAGPGPGYLVKRGYAQLTVDARGTGSSEGTWEAFAARENQDGGEILTWAHEQPWSNGKTAMTGPSYMGISQIWAASAQPPGLKAIFPQVPAADVYRDVVASGGQVDVGFIPLWLGLVTGTGVIPPAVTATDPESGIAALLAHLGGAVTFTGPLMLEAILGGEPAYDGPFYAERSPINVIDRVKVPTFLVSGAFDLFQRGTPLLFERLQQAGVPTKLVIGPWDHLQASSGADIDQAGYGELGELQLRWFDHYVKGIPDPTLDSDIAPLTYYEQGSGAWRTSDKWIGNQLEATSYRLSGSARTAGTPGALTTGRVETGTSDVLPIPVAGLCTRSMNQWTAGILNAFPFDNPCFQDNALNDRAGVVFETAPLDRAVSIQGPINARLYVSSTSGDGMLSVSVEDVAPDGTVSRLTGGWQVISFRELDEARSRHLDGKLIQPYHPFTRESKRRLPSGAVQPVDVEVFPTGAKIRKGHRLRLAVQAFDVPHLLPTLPDALGSLTVITVHTSDVHPSEVTLPTLRQKVPSTTTVKLRAKKTRKGKANRARIRVTAPGEEVRGKVRVRIGKSWTRTVRLHDGRAAVRLPARRTARRHRVRVRYLGSTWVRRSSDRVVWRVRR